MAETEVKTIVSIEVGDSQTRLIDLKNQVKGLKAALDEQVVGTEEYQKTLKEYESRKEELRAAYAAAKEQMTSIEFWRRYLKMD